MTTLTAKVLAGFKRPGGLGLQQDQNPGRVRSPRRWLTETIAARLGAGGRRSAWAITKALAALGSAVVTKKGGAVRSVGTGNLFDTSHCDAWVARQLGQGDAGHQLLVLDQRSATQRGTQRRTSAPAAAPGPSRFKKSRHRQRHSSLQPRQGRPRRTRRGSAGCGPPPGRPPAARPCRGPAALQQQDGDALHQRVQHHRQHRRAEPWPRHRPRSAAARPCSRHCPMRAAKAQIAASCSERRRPSGPPPAPAK